MAVFNAVARDHPELLPRLFQPFMLDRRGEHRPDEPAYLPIQPCCLGADGQLRTFYHSEYFRSAARHDAVTIDPDAQQILDIYDRLCASPDFHLDMWLKRGDMQFISNHTILHARTGYEDWPDIDRKRQLLRLLLSCL